MPFEKVIITHKFGIISQTHKKQLQERLLDRRNQLLSQARKSAKKDDNIINIQITEDFVKEYNESTFEKKSRLDYMCLQMFEKIKKRLVTFNSTDDLNIQLAWAELSQLMQCNSPIQEECLDLFIISMEYAHLSALQIPTLFFLAETVIYWIRTDTVNQPFLRAFEIKLLKVGQLIFQRIYFYLTEEDNQSQNDLKEHLAIYLQGFEDYENAYSPYPDALLYMRYITRVGEYITKDATSISNGSDEKQNNSNSYETGTGGDAEEETLDDVRDARLFEESQQAEQQQTLDSSEFKDRSGLFNELNETKDSLHISPLVTQASVALSMLNRKYAERQLDACLEALIECASRIGKDNWVDSAHALAIVGECAKVNMKALNALLLISNLSTSSFTYDLNRTISNSSQTDNTQENNGSSGQNSNDTGGVDMSFATANYLGTRRSHSVADWPWELACSYADILAEVCVNGSQSTLKKKALLGFNKDSKEALQNKYRKSQLKGYGLLDLAQLQAKLKRHQEDHSWKIRYSAIKALVSVCRALNDKNNEEFRQTCWTSLIVCKENEPNHNVLEAIKVGQISSNNDEQLSLPSKGRRAATYFTKPNHGNQNIYSQMAKKINQSLVEYELEQAKLLSNENQRLHDAASKQAKEKVVVKSEHLTSTVYENNDLTDLKSSRFENLPIGKLTNVNKWSAHSKEMTSSHRSSAKNMSSRPQMQSTNKEVRKRTTLREELVLSEQFQNKVPDFYTRKNIDLMRIVEDQYRKEEKDKFEKELVGNI